MSTVTCHTEDCLNKDIPIELELTTRDASGQVQQITQVWCGACSNPITDIKR